ncbi:hypothetical protein [Nakamurella lactea]|uniref:hypothetical protein n=1 Tax=Nakamurella lactea TaxID=459515 RepID=UPI0003FA6EA3|nr:hypothetical protein [Nakamurella lactea]
MNTTIIKFLDGGDSSAFFVADSQKAMPTTVPVRQRAAQGTIGVLAAGEVFGVVDATLGRTGGQLG